MRQLQTGIGVFSRVMPRLRQCRKFFEKHKKSITAAVTIVSIIAALLFFAGNGKIFSHRDGGKKDGITRDFSTVETVKTNETVSSADKAPEKRKEKKTDGFVLTVDISGAVKNPGVYSLQEDARMEDVISAAGGLTAEADIDAINRASAVKDGQKLYIPAVGEAGKSAFLLPNGSYLHADESTGGVQETQRDDSYARSEDGRLNLNFATQEELMSLNGIGEALSERIITYRKKNGGFTSPEELKNVKGIGEKLYAALQNDICV